jgi:glutamate--cysteine ligase
MTAQQMARPTDEAALTLDSAREHVAAGALRPSSAGRVGLELEAHLVDLTDPLTRPSWARVQTVLASLPGLPGGSSVTLEPGGQIELSTTPQPDAFAAVDVLARDRSALGRHLREHGFGAAALGADPARRPQRINPGARYVAMEQHFAAIGCGRPARAMMTSTAALQVNLDAGPEAEWAERWQLVQRLLPVLVAASAASPWLGGRSSGWHSMRREAWHGLDARRTGVVAGDAPAAAWADYAMSAPVMLVRDADGAHPVRGRVPFAAWISGHAAFDRAPSVSDLDYHLTTLFPPVRPRGYLELRGMDAAPDRWWAGLVALAVTLIDDPAAAQEATGHVARLDGHPAGAARLGCADPVLRGVVLACLDTASRYTEPRLRSALDDLATLIESGRSVSDMLRRRIDQVGPIQVLQEEADA